MSVSDWQIQLPDQFSLIPPNNNLFTDLMATPPAIGSARFVSTARAVQTTIPTFSEPETPDVDVLNPWKSKKRPAPSTALQTPLPKSPAVPPEDEDEEDDADYDGHESEDDDDVSSSASSSSAESLVLSRGFVGNKSIKRTVVDVDDDDDDDPGEAIDSDEEVSESDDELAEENRDEGIVRDSAARIRDALKNLMPMFGQSASSMAATRLVGQEFGSNREKSSAHALEVTKCIEEQLAAAGMQDTDEDGEPEELPAYRLAPTLLRVIEQPYENLHEHLSTVSHNIMQQILIVYHPGQPMATDASAALTKIWTDSYFHRLCKSLFSEMFTRTKHRLYHLFIASIWRMFSSDAVFELCDVAFRVLNSDPDPACHICGTTVAKCPDVGAMAATVPGIQTMQHKATTFGKNRLQIISPHPSIPQGVMNKARFVVCSTCHPMIALFNQILLAPHVLRIMAQLWLIKHVPDASNMPTGKSVLNAFQQWETRRKWADATIMAFKALHLITLD